METLKCCRTLIPQIYIRKCLSSFTPIREKKNFRIGTVSEFLLNNCVIAMALFRTTRPLIPYQQLMVLWKSPRITPRERMFSDSGKSTGNFCDKEVHQMIIKDVMTSRSAYCFLQWMPHEMDSVIAKDSRLSTSEIKKEMRLIHCRLFAACFEM